MIVTKRLNDVSNSVRRTFERAKDAVANKNYPYAFEMLRGLLRSEPGFYEGRMMLRQAQLERAAMSSTLMRRVKAMPVAVWTAYVKGPRLLKKGLYAKALDAAENAMQQDPTFLPTVNFLADAALQAKLSNVAIATLETAVRQHQGEVQTHKRLAELYIKVGEEEKALTVMQELCNRHPDKMDLQNEYKQVTALVAMKKGKWDQADSFKGVVRDEDAARLQEQREQLSVHDDDTLTTLIADAEKTLVQQPSVTAHRRLADLYRKGKKYEKALEQYQLLVEKMGALDPSVDQAIMNTLSEQYDAAVLEWEAYGKANPEKKTEAEGNIKQIKEQKAQTIFDRIKARAERYPNEGGYRFELGEQYYNRDRIDDALREFQVAQRNPRYKRSSQTYIARCMTAQGMVEMAIEQYLAVVAEIDTMNGEKKQALYELASLYERQGRNDDALNCLKDIYSADANFRDVSKRLQKFYNKKDTDNV